MSFTDWFRKPGHAPADTQDTDQVRREVPEPKELRLRGQIRSDDIFPSTTDTE